MRREVLYAFEEQPELKQYCRQHPYWYRRLGRNPQEIQELQKAANVFYGRTFPQRVDKVQQNLGMVMMLLEMLRSVKPS